MSRDQHPDFLAAPEGRRWTKPLAELATVLRAEAWRARGAKVWYILPGGACVSMWVVSDGPALFRKRLRVSRRGTIEDDKQAVKWAAECSVFRQHLDCEKNWHTVLIAGAGQRTEWVTMEDAPLGRAAVQENKCSKCDAPTPHEPEFKSDLCTKCAAEAGAADVASRQAPLHLL